MLRISSSEAALEARPSISLEIKRLEDVDAPYDPAVLEQATEYAETYKASLRHIATHNVNFLVVWDSVTFRRVDQFAVTLRDISRSSLQSPYVDFH